MKVTLTFEMDKGTAKFFTQNALERVINSSIEIIEDHNVHEWSTVNLEDWEEWKPILTTFYAAMQNAAFCSLNNIENTNTEYVLKKGEL